MICDKINQPNLTFMARYMYIVFNCQHRKTYLYIEYSNMLYLT